MRNAGSSIQRVEVLEVSASQVVQRNDPPSSETSSDTEGIARQRAQQVYDSLSTNNTAAALNALQGHDQAMRSRISDEFQFHIHPDRMALRTYLKDQLEEDDLVRAIALLHAEHYHDLHVAMALTIIPVGTRNAEIFRILNSLPLAGRQQLEQKYNDTFYDLYGLGNRTLKQDLRDALGGLGDTEERYKSLALLDHDLTSSEHLYLDSLAVTGTRTDSVVHRLQAEWDQGPQAFATFETDWDRYVCNQSGWSEEEWTNLSLRDAMVSSWFDSELSGEAGDLVRAIFQGADQYQGQIGVETGPLSEEQQFRLEEIQLEVADQTLTAATTGGYESRIAEWTGDAIGLGTNSEQVFRAVREIRRIWQARIDRAEAAHDESNLARYRQGWEAKRASLMAIVVGEMDEGTADYQQARLIIAGEGDLNLTPGDLNPAPGDLNLADQVYLAGQNHNHDEVIRLITRFWAQGQIDQLLEQAQTAREDDAHNVLRPTFEVNFLVPVTIVRTVFGEKKAVRQKATSLW